ncbi:MAG TPA: epoxyqueuosine reductase QueH [Thermoplasmata archaeon]|nr:epoxyqueuosine reductase QueH [Thermoplasmata archaeon]
MKILVHVCCAPCFAYVHERLTREEHDITGYWYNPNIHPYMEYKARRDALKKYAELENVKIVYESYDFIEYLKMQLKNAEKPDRCLNCYSYRMKKTAEYAKKENFDTFTTTLLVSPYQYHEEIKKIGNDLSKKYGINFYYEDFRKGFNEGKAITKLYSLYRQQYCGCLISEWERFGGKKYINDK